MDSFETDIGHCITVLEQGGLILYPTDTIWGIGCDATNEAAVQKIFELKERSNSKSMIVLIPEEKDLLRYVASPDPMVFDFLKTTTRPTTIIYDDAIGLAHNLVHVDGSIAIRVVKDAFCRHLLKRFRKPIVSTSANLSGDPSPKNFSEVIQCIRVGVDYIVERRQEEKAISEASTIIRWNKNGPATVIRP